MKNKHWLTYGMALVMVLVTTKSIASSWQEQLVSSSEHIHRSLSGGTQSGGLSLSSLSSMLEGGNAALSANTIANAAGVIEYCTQYKLSSMMNAEKIQSQLVQKLGLHHPHNSAAKNDYTQGQLGLLNIRNGQQLDMSDLSHSELARKVKTKACDLVLKQGMDYLSR